MDVTELRERVLEANRALPAHGLVKLSSGNASEVDRERGVMAIKASGVDYATMGPQDVVLVDLADGTVADRQRRPSTDTPTHLGLYRALPDIGGIVHTHSTYATAWAQAGRPIPVLGTTHADFSAGPVPVTRLLSEDELAADYEAATAGVLLEVIDEPAHTPAALVRGHAPFCWAVDAAAAVQAAVNLEQVAQLALLTVALDAATEPLDEPLRRTHFERKHGPGAYYGQN